MSTVHLTSSDGTFNFTQSDDDYSILQAALRNQLPFPYECNAGGCGSCRFIPMSGEYETLMDSPPGLSKRDIRKGMQLACQTRATSNMELKVRADEECRPSIVPRLRTATLESCQTITHDIVAIGLRTATAAQFLPGQYAILTNGEGVRRCYSMSNTPNEDGAWEFQIKRVPGGAFSDGILDPIVGDSYTIDGPYGMAFLRTDSNRDILCVAGGSGLSPMVSIIRGVAAEMRDSSPQVHLFYGGRTPRDVAGNKLTELLGLDSLDRLCVTSVISEPEDATSLGWDGEIGFVHESVERNFSVSVTDMEIYFAGPPAMTEALQRLLMIDLQVPFDQIHFDRFF